MTIVTAEMIDEAMEAANSIIHLTNTGGVFARDYCNVGMMRAALEAVEPMFSLQILAEAHRAGRVQGLREAADICNVEFCGERADELMEAILVRAQELVVEK